mmetsp:Transcript_45563/g.82394  ORF Transcript_45563/g.82394 Transcript_45563/m.82394 type:complete len:326 (-) Transcript_45563:78-1055(-)
MVSAAKRIQAQYNRYKQAMSLARRLKGQNDLPAEPQVLESSVATVAAAKRIQAGYRGHASRKHALKGHVERTDHAGPAPPRKHTVEHAESHESVAAAKKIQAAARRRLSQRTLPPDLGTQSAQREKQNEEVSTRKSSVERLSIPAKGEDGAKKPVRSKSKRSTTFQKGFSNKSSEASMKGAKQQRASQRLAAPSGSAAASSNSTAAPAAAPDEQAGAQEKTEKETTGKTGHVGQQAHEADKVEEKEPPGTDQKEEQAWKLQTHCSACGNEFLEDAQFCRKCGQKRELTQDEEQRVAVDSTEGGTAKVGEDAAEDIHEQVKEGQDV